MAEPQQLRLAERHGKVLQFCMVSGAAEYLDVREAPHAGDLLHAPGYRAMPVAELPNVAPPIPVPLA